MKLSDLILTSLQIQHTSDAEKVIALQNLFFSRNISTTLEHTSDAENVIAFQNLFFSRNTSATLEQYASDYDLVGVLTLQISRAFSIYEVCPAQTVSSGPTQAIPSIQARFVTSECQLYRI